MNDESKELYIESPKILVTQYIPMGKNNMVSINRHIGAHKAYKAPTEFGMRGAVKDIKNGVFQMEKSGVFLKTVEYSFSNYINAELKNELDTENKMGLSLDKDGMCSLGININNRKFTTDEIKIILGKITYRSVDYVYPILKDEQQSLLSTLYGAEDILSSHFSITTYGLVITNSLGEGIEINNTKEFRLNHPHKIDAITDWIIDDNTVEGCHIFIGMRAAICVGKPSKNLRFLLQTVLFLKSIFNASFRLFSLIWALGKTIKNINDGIPQSSYKKLKSFNMEIAVINNAISRLKILDKMMDVAIAQKKLKWDNSESKKQFSNIFRIEDDFKDEIDKSNDRNLILEQIGVDLQGLRASVEQKMDLIMTKNSEFLNVVLLVLTLISVIGIADILGFNVFELGVVLVVMIPFIIASIVYIKNYIRNFRSKKS